MAVDSLSVLVPPVPFSFVLIVRIPPIFAVPPIVAAPTIFVVPPTFRFSDTPTPPVTTNAPVTEVVEVVPLLMVNEPDWTFNPPVIVVDAGINNTPLIVASVSTDDPPVTVNPPANAAAFATLSVPFTLVLESVELLLTANPPDNVVP